MSPSDLPHCFKSILQIFRCTRSQKHLPTHATYLYSLSLFFFFLAGLGRRLLQRQHYMDVLLQAYIFLEVEMIDRNICASLILIGTTRLSSKKFKPIYTTCIWERPFPHSLIVLFAESLRFAKTMRKKKHFFMMFYFLSS